MSDYHLVVTRELGVVALIADRLFHTDLGALLFFSWTGYAQDREELTATFAPGAWTMHLKPKDENDKIIMQEQLGFALKVKHNADQGDAPQP